MVGREGGEKREREGDKQGRRDIKGCCGCQDLKPEGPKSEAGNGKRKGQWLVCSAAPAT